VRWARNRDDSSLGLPTLKLENTRHDLIPSRPFTSKNSLDTVLAKIATRGLPCILAGDINIDLTKCVDNTNTAEYIDK
jgi:hypothetical protein